MVQAWAEAVRDARDRSVCRVHVAACAVCSGAICGSFIHELGDEHVPGWLHRCRSWLLIAAKCHDGAADGKNRHGAIRGTHTDHPDALEPPQ